jgi:GNAT superfamily N-acetyltransferase
LEEARRAREERERVIDSALFLADLIAAIDTRPWPDSSAGRVRVMTADGGALRPVTDWRGEIHEGRKTLTLYLGTEAAARGHGLSDAAALDRILAELDGWNRDSGDFGDILEAIVALVKRTGRSPQNEE